MSGNGVRGPADWHRAWGNYDDEALAALASTGLLRRAGKDVEAGKVGWHPDGGAAAGLVAADGQRVELAIQGPGGARCDCPAPGICKHILAAALWLRAPAATDAPAAAATEGATEAGQAGVLDEVLALDQDALFKAAGTAAVRKAAGMLAGLGRVDIAEQGAVLVIAIPELDLVCRYVAGTGYEGMVSGAAPRLAKALHLLALAAVWHAHGRVLPWPAQAGTAPSDADTTPSTGGVSAEERRFLLHARALVHETCAAGWSHVSDIAAPQLRALATSARVESFPRLAGLLRGLAGIADLLAARDFGADEAQALQLAAQAHALIHALGAPAAQADPALLARLRGTARRSFEAGATLELLPLGSYWWEARSGARGLTSAFWDPQAGQVRQAVLARRDDSDPGFSKDGAWARHSLWPGAGAAAALAGKALVLEEPRLAEDGRLGTGGATRASTQPAWLLRDSRWQEAGFDDWSALREAIAGTAGLLGEPLDMVLLRPAACEQPQLDEAAQQLTWRIRDRAGRSLTLRLPYEAWKAARLDNVEAWAASGDTIAGVGARLERGGQGLLEPVTLLVGRDARVHPVSLDFEAGQARPMLATRIRRMLRGRTAPAAAPAVRGHGRVVHALLAQLERKAMSGHLHLARRDDELHALRPTLLALGLDGLAHLLARYLAAPDVGRALALYHAGQTCLELDTGFL
ncbi:SWIM zinc finger family protein [Massilia niabensis]|uniref:SWIM zinc finger family protein n=1 Tax=Massilia niabensis TaxID=544910 RepID=A0ABW0L7Q3_9BURK